MKHGVKCFVYEIVLGFEEYINLILDDAGKVNIKRKSQKL
ncbi:hypothetical protein ACB092_05G101200 [Castanea dentata]